MIVLLSISFIYLSSACSKGNVHQVGRIQESCDLDAFLCRNELLFNFQEEPLIIPFRSVAVERVHFQPMRVDQILEDMIDFTLNFPAPPKEVLMNRQPSIIIQSSMSGNMMDKVMDDMLGAFFETTRVHHPEIDAINLAKGVAAHGDFILQQPFVDEGRRRLAHRLIDVQPSELNSNVHFLPTIFGKDVDSCLGKRFHSKTLLSEPCAASLSTLKTNAVTNSALRHTELKEIELSEDVSTFGLIFILIGLNFFLLIFLVKKYQLKRLRRSILNAVYSSPSIKAQVASEIGQEMGDSPPMMLGASNEKTCLGDFCYSLPLFALSIILCYTSFVSPEIVIAVGFPSMAIFTVYYVSKTLCCGTYEQEADQESDTVHNEDEAVYVAVPAVI
jgi:hypothetical protein